MNSREESGRVLPTGSKMERLKNPIGCHGKEI